MKKLASNLLDHHGKKGSPNLLECTSLSPLTFASWSNTQIEKYGNACGINFEDSQDYKIAYHNILIALEVGHAGPCNDKGRPPRRSASRYLQVPYESPFMEHERLRQAS